ncbi:MAG: hypothetical protein AAGH46_12695, partial [Bacteroidota bacterium]
MDNIDFTELKIRHPNLYKTLNEYYGIDSPKKHNIEELILRAHNSERYVSYWKNGILKKIEKEINHSIQGITFGFIPNYGGEVYFSTEVSERRNKLTKIQLYLSLLDNVYTIQVLETIETVDILPVEKIEIRTETLKELWVSPGNHPCSELFLKIQNCLDKLLESPVFLPYSIQEIELKGVSPPGIVEKERYFVRDAFFRTIMPQNCEGALIYGDHN